IISPAPEIAPGQMSEAEAEKRLTRDRSDILAMIAKADHRLLRGDNRAANAYYTAAIGLAGRTPHARPDIVNEVARARDAIAWLGELFKQHLLTGLDRAGFPPSMQHPRFRKSLDMMLGAAPRPPENRQYPQRPLAHYYAETDYFEFANTSTYDWVPLLGNHFAEMKAEALALLSDHGAFTPYVKTDTARPQVNHHGLLENESWSTLHLWQNGAAVAAHVERCPKIFNAVMSHVPLCHIGPRAPSIMLSLLRPGARIPPHTGMLNSRLICHLPLVVPPDCGFRVGNSTIEWHEGKVIAFDDTVEHEAWNNSSFDRLVLIFDIWRPELSIEEREQIVAMFAAVDSY
ncbi:MAG: aspartyl/asparaginyl beta-hydroxylase domain-containing protein, partial [Sphingorhabdus sp.]